MVFQNLSYHGYLLVLGKPDNMDSWLDFVQQSQIYKHKLTPCEMQEAKANYYMRFANYYRCDVEVQHG